MFSCPRGTLKLTWVAYNVSKDRTRTKVAKRCPANFLIMFARHQQLRMAIVDRGQRPSRASNKFLEQ